MTAFALHLTWFNVVYNTKTKLRLVWTKFIVHRKWIYYAIHCFVADRL